MAYCSFDQWQLYLCPPGLATIAINESFNKQFKETFTKHKAGSLRGMLKKTIPSICKYYRDHKKPFALYPRQTEQRKEVIEKAKKLEANQFWRQDFNNFKMILLLKLQGNLIVTLLESVIRKCVLVRHIWVCLIVIIFCL